MKSFGKRSDHLEYKKRTGSYGIIKNTENQFLVVEDEDGNLYLIGGGIKEGETALEALLRESLEETGHKINVRCFLGKAENHWVSSKYPNWSQHNIRFFYLCQLEERGDRLKKNLYYGVHSQI